MTHSITVHKMYKYRLYRNDKKDRKLRHKLFVASTIWNHFIALQRRYYRLSGKYISLDRMNRHVLKLRNTRRFALWRELYSQVCQDVCKRVDDAYQRFFSGLAKRPPKFKKARKYTSFTFPQSGYKVVEWNRNQAKPNQQWTRARGAIKIDGVTYRFVQHRPCFGQVKTLTVKRDSVGQLWLVFSVVETIQVERTSTGQSGGFDFGLKAFLTDDEGGSYSSPQFFAQSLRKTKRLNRLLSRKVEGSKRRKRVQLTYARHSADIANRRRDFHFKLAHRLCDEYDLLCFEDLNLEGMKALWGRKVSDLGFGQFMTILEWVALKRGKRVVKIDRWYASTQTCHICQHKNPNLTLRDREWLCPTCGTHHLRDHNAAINIKNIGASMVCQSDSKPRVRLRRRVDGRSPGL